MHVCYDFIISFLFVLDFSVLFPFLFLASVVLSFTEHTKTNRYAVNGKTVCSRKTLDDPLV